ncbi:MAG: hypothetical protein JKY33_03725 [Bacteroidia bacterium]|nr:hypothetical protein [Bacteroidia bacterium]
MNNQKPYTKLFVTTFFVICMLIIANSGIVYGQSKDNKRLMVVPENVETTQKAKPAIKKMKPVLLDDPWGHKLETYDVESEADKVLKMEPTNDIDKDKVNSNQEEYIENSKDEKR